jgi:RHS repeat-associated protein
MSQPFGDNLQCTGTDSSPYKFGKLERDLESGDDHAQHRDYNSNPYRWLSPDPGPWIFLNPQSYNGYSYALNNPLRYTDDGGETAQDRVIAALNFAAQNIPYQPGGKNPDWGLDCSGFVQNVFKADPDNPISALANVNNAASQASLLMQGGDYSPNINNAQPGDAIFFKDSNGNIVHTGIVVDVKEGRVYFIHAPGRGGKVGRNSVPIKTGFFGVNGPNPGRIPPRWFAGVGRPFEPTNHPAPGPVQNYSPNGGGLWSFLEELFFNRTPPAPPLQGRVTSTFVCGVQGTPPCR